VPSILTSPFSSHNKNRLDSCLLFLLGVFCFASASTVMTAVMNASFFIAVLLWCWWLFENKPTGYIRSGIFLLFCVLCLIFVVAIFNNYYLFDNNINEFKKDYLKPLLVFLMASTFIRGEKQVKALLLCFAFGFALRSVLLVFYYGFDLAWLAPYRRGYALDSIFYVSLTSVLVLFGKNFLSEKTKNALRLMWLIEGFVLILHQSRSPLLAICFGLFCVLMINGAWRKLSLFVGGAVLAAGLLLSLKPQLWERYASTFNGATYHRDGAVMERKGIWLATGYLIEEKPLFGHGPGWRKLSPLVLDSHIISRLKSSNEIIDHYGYVYFTQNASKYGKANPHNLYLQVMLEIGVVGLLCYLMFLFLIFWQAFRQIHASVSESVVANSLLVIVPAFLLVGFANGLWANAVLLMMLAGILVSQGVPDKLLATAKKGQK